MAELYNKPTTWKRIVRGILDVIAAILLVSALIGSFVTHVVFNKDIYKKVIFTEAFDQSIEKNIYDALDSIYTIVDIPSDRIIAQIGLDPLIAYEHEYTNQFIDSMVEGVAFEPKNFDSQIIRNLVESELNSLEGVTVSDEDFESICECVDSKINGTLQYIPSIITNRIGSISKIVSNFKFFSKIEIPLYMGFALFAMINFLFGGKNHVKDVFFGLSAACWIGVATVSIPLAMIYSYDFPSHLVLQVSTLKWLVVGLFNVVFKYSSMLFNCTLAVLSVILFVSSYVKAAFVKKPEKKHFHHVHFDNDFDEQTEIAEEN